MPDNSISKDIFVYDDINNPNVSERTIVYPTTTLDQVFDPESDKLETLREILENLKQLIVEEGLGVIVFPVTSVNKKTGDVVLTADDIGLGNVNNTSDNDKPLSDVQKEAIYDILGHHDFNIDLTDMNDHINDYNNPHKISINDLDDDGSFTKLILYYISLHNYSIDSSSHMDIRRSLEILWDNVDFINEDLKERLNEYLNLVDNHANDPDAHIEIINKCEKIDNKVSSFDDVNDIDPQHYPSTIAVSKLLTATKEEIIELIPDITEWVDTINVVAYASELPNPTHHNINNVYIIRYDDNTSQSAIATCVEESSNIFKWDIKLLGSISRLDEHYFEESTNGMTLRIKQLSDDLVSEGGPLDQSVDEKLSDYYTKDESDAKYITSVQIESGTIDGSFRYRIDYDNETDIKDVRICGLQRLAFTENVSSNEIEDNSINSNHIVSNSIESNHISESSVEGRHIKCGINKIIGNIVQQGSETAYEITIEDLANELSQYMTSSTSSDIEELQFTGNLTIGVGMEHIQLLSETYTSNNTILYDSGGQWYYQTNPKRVICVNGTISNGDTTSAIVINENGMYLHTLSSYDRMDAPYNIWIKIKRY